MKPDQLDFYLDEFVFRFNRRTSRSRGLLFYRLMHQAVLSAPVTYADVTNKRVTQHRRVRSVDTFEMTRPAIALELSR